MKMYLMMAGITALAAATPALAKPDHNKNHRQGHGAYGTWGNSCPPGLAKKRNGCQAPGQARKRYKVGQRWSNNYGQSWSYNQIPNDWRDRYNLDANDRYYYRDGYLYQVDTRTRLVEQVLSAILR